ncbi:MAG: hypothetical protein FWB74_00560, partial [Defluviitaleaceae bacterium]|nr:hypothetical protein [Defluviitaleaceae bacterium]
MLCRQCNGAVGANDGVCKTCGHPVRRGSNSKGLPRFAKFALIFLVLGACASFVVLYATGRIEFEFFGQSAPASSDEGLNLESDSTEYPPDTTTESSDTYAPTARRDEEAWHAMLANLHTVSSNYITSSAFHPFLTRGGFLYHLTEEAFITPEFFVSRNVLGEEYLAELKMIFYLRPVDFAGFDEIDLPPSNQMTVFVGYETVSGIGLYSIYGHHEIFRENLNKILLSYTPASGPSGRASSGQHIFDITVPNLGENINVRYFAYDE